MMGKRNFVAIMAMAFCTLPALSAQAIKIYGVWRSNSGNVFEIPRGNDSGFDLIMTAPNGRLSLMRGQWVEGMEGTQFTYGDKRAPNTATFSAEDPHRIRVVTPQGKANFWRRDRRASRAALWAGTWKSTTGNIFTVAARRGKFHIIIKRTNGQKQVFLANWVEGMEGTQFEYGRPTTTVTYSPENPDRMRVVDHRGRVFWWSRF